MEEQDLVVVGSGMAGMTAAAAVAAAGGRVAVVEKAAELGGSSAMSGGWVWTAPRPDVLVEESPRADPALVTALCEGYDRLMAWIEASGAPIGDEAIVLEYGRGRPVGMAEYLDWCRETVEAAGGSVRTRAQMYALAVEDGAVVGAEVYEGGEHVSLRAPWTLLASGGFQADGELIAAHIHPNAPDMPLRSNRASEGDGLRAALAAGAATSPAMDGFYGHLISWPTDVWVPGVYTLLSQYHSHRAALVNVDGELFEPPFPSDHYNAQWVLRQPQGRAVMVFDRLLYEDQGSPISTGTRPNAFDIAAEHGAHAARAETLDDLGRQLTPWGFATAGLAATIDAFNAAARPPRQTVTEPPFFALEVKAAITFTHGGIRIDVDGQALDGDGRPVPGLLAAGADAGGVHDRGYGGGLAAAGVFGIRAADTVRAALTRPDPSVS
jgi:succinate dehydrogenase/fumarate reductase flavoprotein subunit